jgi:hypothetical protein
MTATACGGGGGSGGGGTFAAPAAVTAAPTSTSGELLVSWAPVADATSYRVYLSLVPGIAAHIDAMPGEIVVRGSSSTELLFTTLFAGGPYYVTVRAGDDVQFGPYAPESVGLPLPLPPDGFVAVAAPSEVVASWSPVPGATSYEIFFASDPTVSNANWDSLPDGQSATTNSTMYRFTGLDNGRPYWAVVRAVNASGASSLTSARSAAPSARGTFLAAGSIPVGDSPQGSVTALLDADAYLDIAVVDRDASTVSVFLGNGDGTFVADGAYPTDAGPEAVIAVDLDGDGGLELVTANNSGTLTVLDGDDVGGFSNRTDWFVGGTLASLTAGQLNPLVDGHLDLVVTDVANSQVAVLYGFGDETFQPPMTFPTGTQPVFVHVADVNADGSTDLLTANAPAGTVSALLGDGYGDFSNRLDSAVGLDCSSLDVGDFDGDGVLDLVVTSAFASNVSFLRGNGDGTFTPFAPVTVGPLAGTVVAGDFNGDGISDLVVVARGDGCVTVLLGDGTGGFAVFSDYVSSAGATAVSVGDFDGDGILDVAVTTPATGDVTILLGSK